MRRLLMIFSLAALLSACGIYSFSGTSIQSDVKSIEIDFVEYKALKVNPSLSNDLTEAIRKRFRQFTKLEQLEEDADLELSGQIVGYDIRPMAVTAQEVAAQNRLTVTVKFDFTNNKYPEDSWNGKSFSAYADYDSNNSLDAVESSLCAEIIEKLVEDIFNASVAQW